MKAKALKTFMMLQNIVKAGQIFEGEEDYIRQLCRNGLAEVPEDLEQEPATDPESGKQTEQGHEPGQSQEPEASKEPEPDQGENAKADKAKGKK